MLRTRLFGPGWLVIALAVSVTVAACKKDDSSTSSSGDKSSGSLGGDDFSLLPADAEVVMGVNAGQILQSGVWKQLAEPAFKKGSAGRRLAEMKEKCDLDPMAAIKTLTFGLKDGGAGQPEGVIVVHGVDKTKGLACIDKMKEPSAEVTRDGDVVMVKDHGSTAAVTFVSDDTAVVVLGAKANPAGVKSVIAGNSGLKAVPAFADQYKKVNTSDSWWFVVTGKQLDAAAAIGAKPKAVAGSLNVTDGLTADIKIVVDSAPVATQLADGLKQKSQLVGAMVDKIDITSEADQVKIAIAMSSQKLQALVTQLGSSLGGFLR
jgi:hypothetical protein